MRSEVSQHWEFVTLTLEEFTYGSGKVLAEEAAAAYEKYAVPERGQIFYEAGFANFHLNPPTEVRFKMQERASLLIVGAEKDHTVPASLAKKQFEKYEKHEAYEAQTDYVEFDRPHLMMVAEGWEKSWAIRQGLDGVLATSPATARDHPHPEEDYPAAFALWIAEWTGGRCRASRRPSGSCRRTGL